MRTPKMKKMSLDELFFHWLREYLAAWAIVSSFGLVLLFELPPKDLDDFKPSRELIKKLEKKQKLPSKKPD